MEGVGIKQGNVISLSPYTEQSGVCVKNEVEQESNLGNMLEERKTSEETLRSWNVSACADVKYLSEMELFCLME